MQEKANGHSPGGASFRDLDTWLEFLRERARQCVVRGTLSRDRAADTVQDTLAWIWEHRARGEYPGREDAEKFLGEIAQRMKRQKNRAHAARRRRRRSIPVLCPRLAANAPLVREPREFLEALRRAAVLVARTRRGQRQGSFRLFHACWFEGHNPEVIAESLGVSPRAVKCRLRRMSQAVEDELVERVVVLCPGITRARGVAYAAAIFEALRALASVSRE